MTRTHGLSQRENIKSFLQQGYSLTALEALSLFGAYRLAAHIRVLRSRDGMSIITTMNKDVTGRTYARYSLVKLQDVFLKEINTHMQRSFDMAVVKDVLTPKVPTNIQSELSPYAHH